MEFVPLVYSHYCNCYYSMAGAPKTWDLACLQLLVTGRRTVTSHCCQPPLGWKGDYQPWPAPSYVSGKHKTGTHSRVGQMQSRRAVRSTEKSRSSEPITASLPVQWKRIHRLKPSPLINALNSHPVVAYALAQLLAVGVKLPTLNNSIIWIDEPIYLSEADRLDTPMKFMLSARYITETKFPLGLVPYIAALWLDHSQAILWMHIFGLLAVVASTILLVALSYRAFSNYVPGILAALLWGIFLTRNAMTIAPLLEYFQTPLILAALWAFARWVKEHSAELLLQRHLPSLVGVGVLIVSTPVSSGSSPLSL